MKKHKILIIEDNIGIREGLNELLEGENYQIELAGNGHEGLMLLKKDIPDMILLDCMMPIMNGEEFLSVIRSDLNIKISNIPVIMMTARGVESFNHIQGMISKPIDIPLFLTEIERVIDEAR